MVESGLHLALVGSEGLLEDEAIVEVGIDAKGRLYVRPSNTSFDYIYRAGIEIYWNVETKRLGQKVKDEDHAECFNRIKYGVRPVITPATAWTSLPGCRRVE
jgi:hypothetical protein